MTCPLPIPGVTDKCIWSTGGICEISGFHRDEGEICAVLGYYTAFSGNPVPTFRDNLSVPSVI
jgi:hypothetical protein